MSDLPKAVRGFADISQEIAEAVKTIKASEANVGALWKSIADHDVIPTTYEDMLAARQHLTIGFILLARAVEQPDDPFSFHKELTELMGPVEDV